MQLNPRPVHPHLHGWKMHALGRQIWDWLIRDDLVFRVIFFLVGLAFAAFGAGLLVAVIIGEIRGQPDTMLAIGVGLLFAALGVPLISGSFFPPNSWLWRLVKRVDGITGLDEAILFVVTILLPAILITFALRAVGISGHPWK